MKNGVFGSVFTTGAVALVACAFTSTAIAKTEVGRLNCDVASGTGLVFGSTKEVNCTFVKKGGRIERYRGRINKYGVDVGFSANSRMIWTVIVTGDLVDPGALAGNYDGASGEVTLGTGIGANVLRSGSNSSIALRPLNVQGKTGLNVAGSIVGLKLTLSGD